MEFISIAIDKKTRTHYSSGCSKKVVPAKNKISLYIFWGLSNSLHRINNL